MPHSDQAPNLPVDPLQVYSHLVDVVVFWIGTDEYIKTWNPGVGQILGYSEEEFVGQHTSLIFIPEDRAIDAPIREMQIAEREGIAPDERWHLRKNGERFWGLGTVRPVYDSGRLIGFVKMFQDLTMRHQQALALVEAKAQAEASEKRKGEFITVVSHELRSPLTASIGAVRLLKDLVPKEAAPYMDIIQRSIDSQIRLIDDLLDVARFDHGKMHYAFATLDAHQAIEEISASVWPEMHRKKVRLKLELKAEAHHISADRTRFEQIVSNLLRNSAKFTPGGGHIDVETSNIDQQLVIKILDNGIGMSEETLAHIFKPFEQASAEQTASYGGLGLGLSITKQLVEAHGGSITATSDGADKGAMFTVSLPIVDPAP